MGTLAQTVLPFKLEATNKMLTANAGLALFGEFIQGLGCSRWLEQVMPLPGSGRGYMAPFYVKPLVLMLTGSGRSLEDLRTLKIGFGMERMPCGQVEANAAFFHIGVIAPNLFALFKHSVLGGDWQRHRVTTVRGRLFHLPGKVVRHAGALVLKVAAGFVELFRDIRSKSYHLAQALAP